MSTDAEIAVLAREAPHDPLARYRWRCALVRAGRGAEAGFEEGDEVSVECADRVPLTKRFQGNLFMGLFDFVAVGKLMGEVCKHNKAWSLLAPAKPKGGAEVPKADPICAKCGGRQGYPNSMTHRGQPHPCGCRS